MSKSVSARAALYVRLSKEDKRGKAEGGIESIAVQTSDGSRAIEAEGWNLVGTCKDDGVSGAVADRPGLAELRTLAAQRQIDVVVVRDLDRLGRLEPLAMMQLVAELAANGVRVWSYHSRSFVRLDGYESLVTHVKAIAGREYIEVLRRNTTEALRARAAAGFAVKPAPFGYTNVTTDKGKFWAICPAERDVILKLGKIYAETGSLNATVSRLNTEGIPAPNGGKWRVTSLRVILTRPLPRGYYEHGGVRVEHPKLRIWPQALLARIDERLARPSKPWGGTSKHLSTRFLRCSVCGGAMVSCSSVRSKSASLVCDAHRSRGCPGVGYRKEAFVDRALLAAVAAPLTDRIWAKFRRELAAALDAQKRTDRREAEIDRLGCAIQASERRIATLTEAVAETDGKGARVSLLAKLETEGSALEALRASLAELQASPAPLPAEAILEEANKRVAEIRDALARGGVEAIPAVAAIMGDEKFKVTRVAEGWRLQARISAANLFVISSNGRRPFVR
jgi:site-specific DNA recombinase